MRRLAAAVVGLALLGGGEAWAVEQTQSTDWNWNNKVLRNLPAPGSDPTRPARLGDVAPGACIPKSTGANTLPLVCSTAGVDYENALLFTSPLVRSTNTVSITANGIGNAQIRQGAATSVVGRSANSTGNVADIAASADGQFLGRAAGALTWTATIAATSAPLTATQVGFGSGANLLTGSASMVYDSSNERLTLNRTFTGGATPFILNNTNTASGDGVGVGFNLAGTRVATMTATRLASGNHVVSLFGASGSLTSFQVYVDDTDVVLARPASQPATTTTTGFVWYPQLQGPPTGVPATGGPLNRATIIDDVNNRFYARLGGAWRYASFDNGNGASAITALTGDVTATGPGSAAATIAADAVGNTKLRNSGALSVIGRSANSTGDPADISASAASDAVLRESGSTLGFGTVATGGIANDAVTLAKVVNFITDSFPCRDTAGTGDLEVCAVGGGVEFTGGPGIQRSALTGDITASAGSNATTLATVNSNVGSFTYGSFTVNAKGLITAASSGATPALAARTLTAGAGMTGGGDLSADRTFDVVAGDATIVVSANSLVAGVMQTANYAADSVTFAKLPNASGASVLVGRGSASGGGDFQEITLGSGLAMTGTVLSATAAGIADADYGDITVSSSGAVWTIDNDVVSNAQLRNSGALTLIGRNVNTSGDPADIAAVAGSGCVYREGSSTIACGTVATAGYADDSVTDAKIREFAGLSVLGRGSNTTGNGADITAGADGDVLRRSGTTLAFGAVPVASVTGAVPDTRTISTTAPLSGGGALSGNLTLTTSMATDRLLGRDTAGTGAAESLTVGGGIEFTGSVGIQTSAFTGDVTKTAGGTALTIATNAVTNSKFRQSAGVSVVGVAGSSSADVADITAGSDGQVLRRSGTTLGFGSIPVASVTGALADPGNNGSLYRTSSGVTSALNGTTGSVMFFGATGVPAQDNANLFWDDANNRLGIGTATPQVLFELRNNVNSGQYMYASNNSAGGAAAVGFFFSGSNTLGSTPYMAMQQFGTGYTTNGLLTASTAMWTHNAASGNLVFQEVNGRIIFTTTASPAGGTERMAVENNGTVSMTSLAGTGTRVVSASSTGLLGIATSAQIAAAITWPAAGKILVSDGTSSAPVGITDFSYDSSNDVVSVSDDVSFAWLNAPGVNYERVRGFYSANVWNLKSEKGGTGNVRAMAIDADTSNLTLDGAAVRIGTLTAGGYVIAAAGSGELAIASPPWTMIFAYGNSVNGVGLPPLRGGAAPNFWMRPNTFYDIGAGGDFATQDEVWEYPAAATYTAAYIRVRIYQCGVTESAGDNDFTFTVTKNGTDTGAAVTAECPDGPTETNTNYDDAEAVALSPGDRIGVRAHVTDTGTYSSGALRATVTLQMR